MNLLPPTYSGPLKQLRFRNFGERSVSFIKGELWHPLSRDCPKFSSNLRISHQLLYAVCRIVCFGCWQALSFGSMKWRRVQPDIWLLTCSAVQFGSQNCVCHTSTLLAQFNHKDGLPLCAASTTEMHNRAQLLQHPNNCSVDSLRYGRRQGKAKGEQSWAAKVRWSMI